MSYALDISQYAPSTMGDLTDDHVKRCLARNIDRWLVSLIDPDIARQQISILAKYPVIIDTFVAYDTDDYENRCNLDKTLITEIRSKWYDVQKHWIDVEEPGFVAGQYQRNEDTVGSLIDSFVGFCYTGIYTSNYMWSRVMGSSMKFSSVPLWYAHWNGSDTLDLSAPFGGWTKGEIHQTLNDLLVEGVWCDTNYYERATNVPAPAPPPILNDVSKWLLQPEGVPTYHYTDNADIREQRTLIRIVHEE